MLNRELYQNLDENYYYDDDRYWGIFACSTNEKRKKNISYKIDPKRFQKKAGKFSSEVLCVINARSTHYFYPAKKKRLDYAYNIFMDEIRQIRSDWSKHKDLIERELQRIEEPQYPDISGYDYKVMTGISSPAAAESRAIMYNEILRAMHRNKCNDLTLSLYAQFFHIMVSRLEAVLVRVLKKNGVVLDRFNRNEFYKYAALHKKTKIHELENYKYHDRAYCIWNLLKHNTATTYNTLKERYPQIVADNSFSDGMLGMNCVKFSNELIEETIDGCSAFFRECCELIFDERCDEASWNYLEYFVAIKDEEFERLDNPLGLDMFDDID